ncbi:MAG: tetratricopeptide repeat protein, partial [Bacteroidota bacterium]
MITKSIRFTLIILIYAFTVTAQDPAIVRSIAGSDLTFEDKRDSLSHFFTNLPDSIDQAKLAECYHDYALRWFYKIVRKKDIAGLDSAIAYFEKAIVLRRNLSPPDFASLKKSLYNQGVCYRKKGAHEKRLKVLVEIASIQEIDNRTLGA